MQHPRQPAVPPPHLLLPLLLCLLLLGGIPCVLTPPSPPRPAASPALSEEELLPLLEESARRHGLSPALVRALVWKESRFRPDAVGAKGELGLMQVTAGAAQDWARVHKTSRPRRRELLEPARNLDIGCWYLARALRHWEGYLSQESLALAEYNAGRTQVLRNWRPADPGTPLHLEEITFPETRDYIQSILQKKAFYETAE
ncbi:MAG: lytic transglycosylase domain-containing protein [Oligosphaeraceae bacterium]